MWPGSQIRPDAYICMDCQLIVFYVIKWLGEKIKRIFCAVKNLISISINTVLLENNHTHLLQIVCGCFHITMAEWGSRATINLKYLASGPLGEKLTYF